MKPEQWENFKKAARLEKMDKIPLALIIDSPWIPDQLQKCLCSWHREGYAS